MKKKLLNLAFVIVACVNVLLISSYVSEGTACGQQAGPTLDGPYPRDNTS